MKAILDKLADRFDRAPRWMRSIGLEWVYRLAREPRRLRSRYLFGNAAFIARVVRLKLYRAGVESRSLRRDLDP
jgi:N-acetylglucosaminyldiphosphoundecaprenol N-acetyl-beta-D-mannosaminyltransferase